MHEHTLWCRWQAEEEDNTGNEDWDFDDTIDR